MLGSDDTVTLSVLPQVALRGFAPSPDTVCFMFQKAGNVYFSMTSNTPPPPVQPEPAAKPEPTSGEDTTVEIAPVQAVLGASVTSVSELPPPTPVPPKIDDPAATPAAGKADELIYGFAFAVTPEEQAKALSENGRQLGATYACVDVRGPNAYFGTLDSVAGYRDGGENDSGYLGRIGITVPGKPCAPEEPWGEECVGVVFPAETQVKLKADRTFHLGAQSLSNLKTILHYYSPNEVTRFVSGVMNPDDGVILAIGDTLKGQEVFCFSKCGEGYRAVSLLDYPDWGYGFSLERNPGGFKTRFHFLPDMNGDGLGEILVLGGDEGHILITLPKPNEDKPGITILRHFRYWHPGYG